MRRASSGSRSAHDRSTRRPCSTRPLAALRALLKTAAAALGLGGRRRASDGPDAGGDGACTRRPRRAGRAVVARRADRRRRRADDRRRAVLPGGARRAVGRATPSGRCCRFRRRKSIRTAAWRRTSTSRPRARARCTGSRRGTARLVVASARALLPRLSAPARLAAAGLTLTPGMEIAPHDLGERLGARRASRREDPVDEHGEFCVRGGVVDFFPAARVAAGPPRVHRRHRRVDPPVRRRDAALARRARSASRSVRSASCSRAGDADDPTALDRSATIVDYVATRRRRRSSSFEIDDVDERGRRARRAVARERGRHGRRAAATVPPYEALALAVDRRSRRGSRRGRRVDRARDRRRGGAGRRTSPVMPALEYHGRIGDWVDEIRAARERGETDGLRRGHAGPRRAHDRAARRLRDPRARRSSDADDLARAAVLVATGQLSRGFHLPDGARCSSSPRPTSSRKSARVHERRRSATRTFLSDFRDLKVGDLVVHVDNGIGRFVGLKKLDGRRLDDAGVHGAPLRRRRQAVRPARAARSRPEVHRRRRRPALDRLGGTTWEKAKTRVKKAMRDMAEELLKLYAARKAVAGPRVQRRHALAAGVRRRVRVRPDAGPADGDRRHHARHGVADADGSPALRRRRLRQDRSRDARGVQGGDGRQAGRVPRADDRARVSAPADAAASASPASRSRIEMISRFRIEGRAEGRSLDELAAGQVDIIVGTHRLLSKDVHVPRPRPARRRRGAALRRRAQGAHQAAAQEGRRADDDGDADSADAEHVARRHPRHVGDRDAAARSAVDPDARRASSTRT